MTPATNKMDSTIRLKQQGMNKDLILNSIAMIITDTIISNMT